MGQSLADAAVIGTQSTKSSEDLLAAGDVEGLMALKHAEFGGFVMKAKDAEDDDSDTDEDEDEEDEDEDSDEEDEDEDSEDEDEDEDEDDAKGKKKDPRDVRIQELSAEGKKRRLKAREDRKRIRDLEAENARLKGTKGKKEDEQDSESEETTRLKAENERLRESQQRQTIRQEFDDLTTGSKSKHKFKDQKAAFRLLDLDDVEVDEDGDVDGLEDAVEDLVAAYPWLLEEPEKGTKGRRKTGQPAGGKKTKKASDEALRKRYRI